MIPTLITWGFDSMSGEPYLSCWLECDKAENAQSVRMLFIRAQFTQENVSLLRLEEGMTRGDVEEWITSKTIRSEVVKKLTEAKVRESDIVRRKHEAGNAMDYLMFD
jgi:hypothetical protein